MRGSGTSYIMGKFPFPEAGRGNLHPQRPSALHGAGPRAMCSCVQAGPALLQLSPGPGIWVHPCSASALTSGCAALALLHARGDHEHFQGVGEEGLEVLGPMRGCWSPQPCIAGPICYSSEQTSASADASCTSPLHPRETAQSLGSRTILERHLKGRVGASRVRASRA